VLCTPCNCLLLLLYHKFVVTATMVVVMLLLSLVMEAAAGDTAKPRNYLLRRNMMTSVSSTSQDPNNPVDLGPVSCPFAPIQEAFALELSGGVVGRFFKLGPFSNAGTLSIYTSDGCACTPAFTDSALYLYTWDSDTASWTMVDNNNNGPVGGEDPCCSSILWSVTAEQVAQATTYLIKAYNLATTWGGYTLNVAFTCPIIPTCPSVLLSDTFLPPNGKMLDLNITILPTDPNLAPPDVRITGIQQNEPLEVGRNRRAKPQAVCSAQFTPGTATFQLAAKRNGNNQGGRTYFVSYEANTADGNCAGTAQVCVPHHRNATCTDDGSLRYDSVPRCT
jgi:hypothetical protein